MKIFRDAYKLIQEGKVIEDFTNKSGTFYNVKDYAFKIYRKGCAWFSQCGCHVGVSNKPAGICKHFVAVIVLKFLESNQLNLKEVKNDKKKRI